MTSMDRRSRSTTGASQRPLSRDSTASIQSAAPRLVRADSMPQYGAQAQYTTQQQHMATSQPQQFDHFTVMQTVPQPQPFSTHGLPMSASDASQHQQYHANPMQSQSAMYHSHSLQAFGTQQPAVDPQYAASVGAQNVHGVPTPDMDDGKKRGGAASTQSNEKELREALEKNMHRSLKDVAEEVQASERTSRAEKTKQLFAMLWLQSSCETAKTSVPRSRVYASYADRCATERVQPLNPASFGKLVRIIFKGIQTRRLGVRGESKYHYVDLALKSEKDREDDGFGRSFSGHEPRSPKSMSLDFGNVPHLPANSNVFAADGSPVASPELAPRRDLDQVDGAVFADPFSAEYRSNFPFSQTYPQQLRFPSPEDEIISDEVELPSLRPYAPEKADEDAADALVALYRSHCTSLIEYFKKCKEKQFWRTFTSFQGTLTVPVQKLLTTPSMAAWIRECDYYMYQRMLTFIARIALQVLPAPALVFFGTISQNLHAHIVKTFSGLPLHVLEARLEPATRFCELVNRMIKVNNAAHAASQVLELGQHRDQLHHEWLMYINPKRLMEGELPGCGYEQTFKILTEDMARILRPLAPQSPATYEDGLPFPNSEAQGDTADNYIDRIDALLRSLPLRFPGASARTIVDCVKNLGTAAMREFTMQGANTFHAWWIVKVFIDEYSQWLVTSGGFLAHRPVRRGHSSPALSNMAGSVANGALESSAEASRHSSAAPDASSSAPPASTGLGAVGMNKGADEMISSTTISVNTHSMGSLRKRRSDESFSADHHDTADQSAVTKRLRLTPDDKPGDAPSFEPPHPSFATTSFGSLPGATSGVDTKGDEVTEFEDSGIGLGLLEESGLHAPSNANTGRGVVV
ncbi:uncharacterized protein PV09_00065 [Verruconis gallopava]|uniref:RFX-type winged-helix domain-containing protein n=1 Tax=Verruconis gallopava TaxID=253628 RepID=A0A0D2AR02_9PEZI|nr:uncharacterized protein PV09_00065 [Verruconis gallopava]KIW09123.1 hypothetical protein PV09_00065 [Verruconis gallopava]